EQRWVARQTSRVGLQSDRREREIASQPDQLEQPRIEGRLAADEGDLVVILPQLDQRLTRIVRLDLDARLCTEHAGVVTRVIERERGAADRGAWLHLRRTING